MRAMYGAEYDSISDIPRLPGGGINAYRVAQFKGEGGSRTESTWDKGAHRHSCCGSAVAWRHKAACPKLEGSLPPDEASDGK